jgi:hypothetical protein
MMRAKPQILAEITSTAKAKTHAVAAERERGRLSLGGRGRTANSSAESAKTALCQKSPLDPPWDASSVFEIESYHYLINEYSRFGSMVYGFPIGSGNRDQKVVSNEKWR